MGALSKLIGDEGEYFAVKYLESMGWTIEERNFCSNHGEVDIIAKHNGILVFVEVKNYSKRSYYPPEVSITAAKRRCIIHAAKFYLFKNRIDDVYCRFDVVTFYRDIKGTSKIDHFKNAFEIN